MEGRCQCGTIQFTTPLPAPLAVYICHCTECRHQSSSAFGVSAIFPLFDLPVALPASAAEGGDGVIKVYSRQAASGRKVNCYFCARCGSRILHRREGQESVRVKGGCLVNLNLKDAIHIWCQEAIFPIPPGSRCFSQGPDE